MKFVTKKMWSFTNAIFINLVVILLFAASYFYLKHNFAFVNQHNDNPNNNITFLDCLFTSITIHAGVGINNIMPHTDVGKWLMIWQQFIRIICHVMTVVFVYFNNAGF